MISHTFAIENDVGGLPEDVNGVHDILARRTDGKSDIEGHGEEEYTR